MRGSVLKQSQPIYSDNRQQSQAGPKLPFELWDRKINTSCRADSCTRAMTAAFPVHWHREMQILRWVMRYHMFHESSFAPLFHPSLVSGHPAFTSLKRILLWPLPLISSTKTDFAKLFKPRVFPIKKWRNHNSLRGNSLCSHGNHCNILQVQKRQTHGNRCNLPSHSTDHKQEDH